jgi:hypothetical protein
LDGDGGQDIAVTNAGDRTVSIFTNVGMGKFAEKVDYKTGINPAAIQLADVNGDGHIDLAVADRGSRTVSVLKNNGDGTFASRMFYEVGEEPSSLTTLDWDKDGDLDLAVVNARSNSVSVLNNGGDGTFSFLGKLTTGAYPSHLLSVYINGDRGKFRMPLSYRTGRWPYSVTAADIDKDGDQDLLTANVNDGSISILSFKKSWRWKFWGDRRSLTGDYPYLFNCLRFGC